MSVVYLFLLLLLVPQINAKNKKKQLLPDYVLRAERVLVVIHPDASEGVTNPMANRTARDEVERAITKWGRFNLVMDAQTADLIIAVRKGNKSGPVISHSPADDRPVILQPGIGDARVGQPQQPGRPPDLTEPFPGGGGGEYPLDTAPVWRYIAKGSLDSPQVAAVEQFRKAIEESEKQHQQKP
jgi:hypothetical protein